MPELREVVRGTSTDLELHQLLHKPPSVLLGVSAAAAEALGNVGVKTVFDLGTSNLFATARAVVDTCRLGTTNGRFGIVPGDLLSGDTQFSSLDEVPKLGINRLRPLKPEDANELTAKLDVQTIRDLAYWPPHVAARKLVGESTVCMTDAEEMQTEELRPRIGQFPTERVYYSTLVMLHMLGDPGPQMKLTGPVSLTPAFKPSSLTRPAVGALLTLSQSWFSQGVTLGHLLHSLALAPGEATRLVVIDWTRRARTTATEGITEAEQLDSASQHSRALSEVQDAVARDFQRGGSRSSTSSSSESRAVATSVGTGAFASLFDNRDVSSNYQAGVTSSHGESSSWSLGNRSVTAWLTQNVNDRTEQHSASVRNRRATAIREVSQSEHEQVSTRVVANYNHMHTLTVQYFEVVQVYRVVAQLHRADRCLFVPMELLDFTADGDGPAIINRFRGALVGAALNRRIRSLLLDDTTAVIIHPVARIKSAAVRRVLATNAYLPVYAQGDSGGGIGGYDLKSPDDRAFPFDYDSSGKTDHLALYRPGTGTMWILKNTNGNFAAVYQGPGIGGYDLASPADLAFAFDYDSSGKMDHLVLYRPGTGTIWILKNTNGNFVPVYQGLGIGGYDLQSSADLAFAFDYDRSGKMDHLALYRPGTGTMWILRNTNGNFAAVYQQGDPGLGIGGYDLKSPADLAFAFDYESSGRMDHLGLYRPGTGTIWILKNTNGNFVPVYQGLGIGGYDLASPADLAFPFDYESSGKMDHLALYRPGTGTMWVLKNTNGNFAAVYQQGDPGLGIGGYDLKSPADRAFAFDYDGSGKMDHLGLYRPGTGTIWILKNQFLLRPDSDDLRVPDEASLLSIGFDGLQVKSVVLHRVSAGAEDLTLTVLEGQVDLPDGVPLIELKGISASNSEDNTAIGPQTGTMTLHCALFGRRASLPALPVELAQGPAVQKVASFSNDQTDRRRELLQHLRDNGEYYSQTVLRSLDSATLTLILSGIEWNGKPLSEQVEPTPVSVAGNYLVLRAPIEDAEDSGVPNNAGQTLAWNALLKQRGLEVRQGSDQRMVPIPTNGVFAEAVLGRSNSAEKLDITRFWNWQESPVPLQPPEIAPVQTGTRATPEDLRPSQLSPPILNIVNPTSLPAPTGLGASLGALSSLNFRNMSGLAGTQGLVQAGMQGTLAATTEAGQLASENMKTEAQKSVAMGQIAADIAKAGISAFTGVPASGGGGVQGISSQGAMINQGKKLDSELPSAGGNGGSPGRSGPRESGALPDSGGGGGSANAGGNMMAARGTESGGFEAAAFRRTLWGPNGESGSDSARLILASAVSADAGADAGPDAAAPAATRFGPNKTNPAVAHCIFCFFGHSGNGVQAGTGTFPNGTDKNLSFKLAADTVADSLRKVYTKDTIVVTQAWTKSIIVDALTAAALPIRQVHLFAHGDSDWVSLAYDFDHGNRLKLRAKTIDRLPGSDNDKAMKALEQEDALATGFLSRSLDLVSKTKIRTNHAAGASWQIWGCFSGYPTTVFTGHSDPVLDKYFKRLNFGQASLDGVAVEIARTFDVIVTAAQGNGLAFSHGTPSGQVVRNNAQVAAIKPFWMWLDPGSEWRTFNASGNLTAQVNMFGRDRAKADLTAGLPPRWLTDAFSVAAPNDL